MSGQIADIKRNIEALQLEKQSGNKEIEKLQKDLNKLKDEIDTMKGSGNEYEITCKQLLAAFYATKADEFKSIIDITERSKNILGETKKLLENELENVAKNISAHDSYLKKLNLNNPDNTNCE